MRAGVEQALAAVGYSEEMDTLSESWQPKMRTPARKSTRLRKAGLTLDEVTAKTFESKIDVVERIDRMVASAEARRTTRCEKSTDIATQPALRFAKRSTKSRTLNSATSKRAKSLESLRLDHHSTAARQPRQRQSKHGSQDEGGQGSFARTHCATD